MHHTTHRIPLLATYAHGCAHLAILTRTYAHPLAPRIPLNVTIWPKLAQIGPKWAKKGIIDPFTHFTHLPQIPLLARFGTIWPKLAQIGQKGTPF